MNFSDELKTLKKQVQSEEEINVDISGVDKIIISGMGGSGIVGNIFSEIYDRKPVTVVSDYGIPSFADEKTLFIAISYSGNTEETLSTLKIAREKGCKVVAITSGGKIGASVDNKVLIPGGIQPRSALGYMLMPLLNTFLKPSSQERDAATAMIDAIDEDNSDMESLAREIWSGKLIPIILGFSPFKWVAYRWKTQFNENSKILAFSNYFPELNHNETMPYRGTYRKDEFKFIVIGHPENMRIEERIKWTSSLTSTPFHRVDVRGKYLLDTLFGLIHKGDYLTYHLAKLLNVDPTDVSLIEELKKKLSR